MNGQIDIFGAVAVEVPPAEPVRRARVQLAVGEVRYKRSGAPRDCDDCWSDQAAASRADEPVPFRRRTAWARRTVSTTTYLCEPHKNTRQSREAQR